MDIYSIQVNQRPLGIGFIECCSGNTEQVVISEVNPNSKGHQLGLTIGDTLIALNDKPIKSMHEYFIKSLPFNLTFRKHCILKSMSDPLSPKTTSTANPLATFMVADTPKLHKNKSHKTKKKKFTNATTKNNHNANIHIVSNITNTRNAPNRSSPFVNNSESNIRDKSYNEDNPKWSTTASVPTAIFKGKDKKPNFKRARTKPKPPPRQGPGPPAYVHQPSCDMINNRFSRNYNRNSLEITDFVTSLRKRGLDNQSKDGMVNFDRYKIYNNSTSICLLSSGSLSKGDCQWSLRIIKCSIYRQEIGIISDADNLKNLGGTGCDSLTVANELGARAIYCNAIATDSIYYASYNHNGTQRCRKELKHDDGAKWKEGDIIKIYLDLDRWSIKFYLNEKKVRKAISVEPYKKYYPVISFIGDCKYQLL